MKIFYYGAYFLAQLGRVMPLLTGLAIRNDFGLHDLGSKLLADCGTPHPDDGAGMIVNELWKQLNKL